MDYDDGDINDDATDDGDSNNDANDDDVDDDDVESEIIKMVPFFSVQFCE